MAADVSGRGKSQSEEQSSSCCSCTCKVRSGGGGLGLERMTGYVLLQDIRDVLPSCIILIVGLAIMVLVIPYAFSSVIKQIQMENALRNITSNITKGEEQQES